MTTLRRVDLSDLHQPAQIACSIHRAVGPMDGPVPAVQIARALDISRVHLDTFDGFEGMLLTDRRRFDGVILANTARGDRRARFTVAHELGHFLMERHVPSDNGGFTCTTDDLHETRENDRHRRQEVEANRFAIELLAPSAAFNECVDAPPDLGYVRELAARLDLSTEATARRYRALHRARIALVFHEHGRVRYIDKSDDFPFLLLRTGSAAQGINPDLPAGTLADLVEGDPKDWFDGPPMAELSVQTLHQSNGYAITLLALTDGAQDADRSEPRDRNSRRDRGSL